MRRGIALLFALVLILSGCGRRASSDGAVYELYFRQAELNDAAGQDAIAAESSGIKQDENAAAQPLATCLLEALLSGPTDDRLTSPFPEGTQLRSVRIAGGRALVDLTSPYGMLSGVELTMADYCITLTLSQLPEVRSVIITVNNRTLGYRATQIFTARDALLSSADDVVAEVEAQLYFCNDEGVLKPETRMLQIYEGDTRAEVLVAELLAGPSNRRLQPSMADGFSVQSVWVKDGVGYVNLPADMLEHLSEEEKLLSVRALILSLLSLESVKDVQLLVDGVQTEDVVAADILAGMEKSES